MYLSGIQVMAIISDNLRQNENKVSDMNTLVDG